MQTFPHSQLSVSLQTNILVFVFDFEGIIFVVVDIVDADCIVVFVEVVELVTVVDEEKTLSLKIGIVWLIFTIGYLKGGSPYAAAKVDRSDETAIKIPKIKVSRIGQKVILNVIVIFLFDVTCQQIYCPPDCLTLKPKLFLVRSHFFVFPLCYFAEVLTQRIKNI